MTLIDHSSAGDAKFLVEADARPVSRLSHLQKIAERINWSTVLGPLLAVTCATLLWSASLRGVDPRHMDDLGLISILPLSFYAALIILTVSFGLFVHRQRAPEPVLLLHVMAFILIIHGTPAILYGTLRYSWAWKHIGIVDYIQRTGSVDPNISVLNVYHNWPGFFALSAFFTEVAGFKSALSFASWAPVFFNLLDVGALVLILRGFTRDRRLIWLSIWFFYLTNWVGQDYFSPQALNYFLHLVILGVCLNWFNMTTVPSKLTIQRWLRFDWATSLFHNLIKRAASSSNPGMTSRPSQRDGLMMMIVLIYIVIATSHQLTPFMTIGALFALVIFQRCSARNLPILMIVLAVTWILYGAVVFFNGEVSSLIQSFGQLSDNLSSNLINLAQVSAGQRLVAIMGRGLVLFLFGLAFLGGIRRLRHDHWDLAAILLTISPFLMVAGNSYGGEVLFRVYFFALPFMAFFAAAVVYPRLGSGVSWWTAALTVLLSSMLLAGFCFAYYGKEKQYYFTPNEVEAAQYLFDSAPAGSLLIEGSSDYPSKFKNYEHFTYVPIANESQEAHEEMIVHPVELFSRWMDNPRYAAAYLIITRSQKAEVDTLGDMSAGSLDRIEQALMQSPKFQVLYENEDATIFILAKASRKVEP